MASPALTVRPQFTRLDLNVSASSFNGATGELECRATVKKGNLVNGVHVLDCELRGVPLLIVLQLSAQPDQCRARLIPTEGEKFPQMPLPVGDVEIAVSNYKSNYQGILFHSPKAHLDQALQNRRVW